MKASLARDRMHLGSHVVLMFWTFLVLFPLWTMIVNSFKFKFDIYTDPFGLPKKWNFESYVSVIKDGDFFLYFRNSLFVTIGSIVFVLLFGAMASYALVNWKHKASRFLYLFFIAGMMLPIKIGSIRLLQLIKGMGLLNTLWGLFPVYTAMGLPIAVFVLTEFIRQIPAELTEAASSYGASHPVRCRLCVLRLQPSLSITLSRFGMTCGFPLSLSTMMHTKHCYSVSRACSANT